MHLLLIPYKRPLAEKNHRSRTISDRLTFFTATNSARVNEVFE